MNDIFWPCVYRKTEGSVTKKNEQWLRLTLARVGAARTDYHGTGCPNRTRPAASEFVIRLAEAARHPHTGHRGCKYSDHQAHQIVYRKAEWSLWGGKQWNKFDSWESERRSNTFKRGTIFDPVLLRVMPRIKLHFTHLLNSKLRNKINDSGGTKNVWRSFQIRPKQTVN